MPQAKGKKEKKNQKAVKLNNKGEIDHTDNWIYKLHTRPRQQQSPKREVEVVKKAETKVDE